MATHARGEWIVTADGRRVSLFSCRKSPAGELQVGRVRSLENAHEDDREHHRPSLLGGAERRGAPGRSSASVAPHPASFGHEADEEQRRFVRDVGIWLARAMEELGIDHVSVFAPARFLGFLRGKLPGAGSSRGSVDLREGDLARLHPHELAAHPAVLDAVADQLLVRGR